MTQVNYDALVYALDIFSAEVADYKVKYSKLSEDIWSLDKPRLFLQTYPLILKELKRRTAFVTAIEERLP